MKKGVFEERDDRTALPLESDKELNLNPGKVLLPLVAIQLIQGAQLKGSPGGMNRIIALDAVRERVTLEWHDRGIRVQRFEKHPKEKLTDDLVVPWANIREIRLGV